MFEVPAYKVGKLQARASQILSEEKKSLLDSSDVRVCASSGAVAVVYPKMTLIGWGFRCRPDSYTGIVKILEMAEHRSIDWTRITAEAFEEICYDYCEYLGYLSVRKMGKTNSRDGGRDLVVKKATKKTRFVPRSWVVQCKLSRTGASVSRGKIGDVAGMCIQYDARGYTVITNAHVDPTLHDFLSALEEKGFIDDHEILSGQELERYLLRNPAAMLKYFGSGNDER